MKQFFLLLALLAASPLFGQVPDGFSYQAAMRNDQGQIMSNQAVSMRLSILTDSTMNMVYQEEHSVSTNEFGLVSLSVGRGTPLSGSFSSISWQTGMYFLEVEVDPTGGNAYTSLGSFQLLTVPFAMVANKVLDADDADADPVNEIQTLSKVGTSVSLSNGGGTFTDEVDDADADPVNEIQTLSKVGTSVSLSNGGGTFTDEVDDADADPVNEIQTLSKVGSAVSLSNGGGTFTDEVDDADADPVNEIQVLSKVGTSVSLSNGGGTFTDEVDDADADPVNEIQVLSKAGSAVSLSNGGGTFTDEVDDADADPVNEIQTLSKVGSAVSLSNGGGTFTDEVDDADADPVNEIQVLSFSNDTLTLSGGGDVNFDQYTNQWENSSEGIYYDGFVGINDTTQVAALSVIDSMSSIRSNTILVNTIVNPDTVTNWARGVYATVSGDVSLASNLVFRGIQGSAEVDNVGGIESFNTGLAGFADLGNNNYGVFGRAGESGSSNPGNNIGVWGLAESSSFVDRGVYGNAGGSAQFETGVFGRSDGTSSSVNSGVFGYAVNGLNSNYGVEGFTDATSSGFNIGVRGISTGSASLGTNYGIYGTASNGGVNYAGYFDGDVVITGNLSKSGGTFKIDHPLDPANQYLIHSFVESPDMLNVYNGNISTDANGFATVVLPDYFEAANKDFKYQLTVIGTFSQAIIAEKLSGNQFVIQTDQPNVEVSWQITGVRNDPWADANRVEVEVRKDGKEAGKYLHPDLYGKSAELGMEQPETSSTESPDSQEATSSYSPNNPRE